MAQVEPLLNGKLFLGMTQEGGVRSKQKTAQSLRGPLKFADISLLSCQERVFRRHIFSLNKELHLSSDS